MTSGHGKRGRGESSISGRRTVDGRASSRWAGRKSVDATDGTYPAPTVGDRREYWLDKLAARTVRARMGGPRPPDPGDGIAGWRMPGTGRSLVTSLAFPPVQAGALSVLPPPSIWTGRRGDPARLDPTMVREHGDVDMVALPG
jgi:hypothetical protein